MLPSLLVLKVLNHFVSNMYALNLPALSFDGNDIKNSSGKFVRDVYQMEIVTEIRKT